MEKIKIKYYPQGYSNNPEANKDAIDNDGWLHTGDIGQFDSDGYLYIVDRVKDILKYQSFQISPTELENTIMKIDGIQMACVVGIPDPVSIELPAAAIIRNGSHITANKIYKFVEGLLIII